MLVRAHLAAVSDEQLIRSFDEILRRRGLPEVGKAADDEHEDEDFAERYLAAPVRRIAHEFGNLIDAVMRRVRGLIQRGEAAIPLRPSRGDEGVVRRTVAQPVRAFLAHIGYPEPGDTRPPAPHWQPVLAEQATRFGALRLPEGVEWQAALATIRAQPPSRATLHAAEYAAARAGTYLRPVVYRVGDETVRRLLEADRSITRRVMSMGDHADPAKLAELMADLAGSWTRDWMRVARTEAADAAAHGNLIAHLEAHPANTGVPRDKWVIPKQLAFKIPQTVRRNAAGRVIAPCQHCHRIWYYDDTTPRLYPLAEVVGNGSNAGPPARKAANWVATVGPTHPNDLCGPLHYYSPGSDSLYPGFRAQLARFAGQGFEGVD